MRNSFNNYIDEYIEYRKKQNLSDLSCYIYKKQLTKFAKYLERAKLNLASCRKNHIEEYIAFLQDNEKCSVSFINQMISSLKGYFEYLKENKKIPNPTDGIPQYKFETRAKKLGSGETSEIVRVLEEKESLPVRDRVILLLSIQHSLNGTAICNLKITDIVEEGDILKIERGKGSIKIDSPKLIRLLKLYLDERKNILDAEEELFLTKSGKPIQKPHITYILKRFSELSGIECNSLVLLSKANRIEKADLSNLLFDRYVVIKQMPGGRKYDLFRVVDRRDGNTNKFLRIYSFKNKLDKLMPALKRSFTSLRLSENVNIIKIFDLHIEERSENEVKLLVATEYFEAKSIKQFAGKLSEDNFCDIAEGLLAGLSDLHKKGIVHGDINTSCISIQKASAKIIPKICDIGQRDTLDLPILVLKGGNPFVSPEYYRDERLDKRSDIYSLGILFYYLLLRKYPKPSSKNGAVENRSLDEIKIQEQLKRLINRMIEINPDNRFDDAEHCLKELLKIRSKDDKKMLPVTFTIKLHDEISEIENAIKGLNDRNYPNLILIKGKNNTGKSYLINEARTISIVNSVPYYQLSADINTQVKKLSNLFQDEIKKIEGDDQNKGEIKKDKNYLLLQANKNIIDKSPFVLAIDNLNEASCEFFDFYCHLLQDAIKKRTRAIFLISLNDESRETHFERNLLNLIPVEFILTIELKIFSFDDISKILEMSFDTKPERDVIEYVFNTSAGKLRKVTDIVNFLLENEYLVYDEKGRIVFSSGFYKSVEKRIDSNFDNLSNLILTILSVIKRPVDILFLFNIIKPINPSDKMDVVKKCIDHLVQKRVLSLKSDRNSLSFENNFTKNLYYRQLDEKDRVKFHDLIAHELEKSVGDYKAIDEATDEIAHHFLLSENKEKIYQYYSIRAQDSVESGFFKEALIFYDYIFKYFDTFSRDIKLALSLNRAKIRIELCELNEASRDLSCALNLVKTKEEIIDVKILEIKKTLREGRLKEGLSLIEESLKLASQNNLKDQKTQVLILKGTTLIQLSRYNDVIEFINNELLANRDQSLSLYLNNQLGIAYFQQGEFEKAYKIFKKTLVDLETLPDEKIKLRTLNNLGMLHFHQSRFDEAIEYYSDALTIAEKLHDTITTCAIMINLGGLNYRVGRFNDAAIIYEKISDMYATIGEGQNYENLLLQMGLLYANIGFLEKARFYHQKCEIASKDHANNFILGCSYTLAGEIERLEGEMERAVQYYTKAEEIFIQYYHIRELAQIYIYKIKTFIHAGRASDVRKYLTKLYDIKNLEGSIDINLRILLLDVHLLLSERPINCAEIDQKLDSIKDDQIIRNDCELYLSYLMIKIQYSIILGERSEADNFVFKLKNELRRIIDGFPENISAKFFKESEYGRFIADQRDAEPKSKPSSALSLKIKRKKGFDEIIGKSNQITKLIEQLEKISESEGSILIEGESGTGKELIARAIYENSKRNNAPFIAVNCAAFSLDLLPAELFGYKKGAFTDAFSDRRGIVELADGGTLFFDNLSSMASTMQVKLLQFLETGEFIRIGDENPRRVDVRIISASNAPLKMEVLRGKFRLDLYHRLNEFLISIPPLRERKEDIPLLVRYFIEKYNRERELNLFVDERLLERFDNYDWPGNVRELENELNRLIVLRDGNLITTHLFSSKT